MSPIGFVSVHFTLIFIGLVQNIHSLCIRAVPEEGGWTTLFHPKGGGNSNESVQVQRVVKLSLVPGVKNSIHTLDWPQMYSYVDKTTWMNMPRAAGILLQAYCIDITCPAHIHKHRCANRELYKEEPHRGASLSCGLGHLVFWCVLGVGLGGRRGSAQKCPSTTPLPKDSFLNSHLQY